MLRGLQNIIYSTAFCLILFQRPSKEEHFKNSIIWIGLLVLWNWTAITRIFLSKKLIYLKNLDVIDIYHNISLRYTT